MSKTSSRSDGQSRFAQIPRAEIQRSQFDRSHGVKSTFNAGILIPFFVDEALPGDTFNLRATIFARLATPLHPFMDNITIDTHYFSVPMRLLWDNWQRFNGEQDNPADSTDFLVPIMTSLNPNGFVANSLSDYFGMPTSIPDLDVSAMWHRAYNQIYNAWYRDENLQDSCPDNRGDGPDDPTDYICRRRGKRHDFFSSALPWPQKGPSVLLPLGTTAPVVLDATSIHAGPVDSGVPTFNVGGSTGNTLTSIGSTNVDVEWNAGPASSGSASWDDANLGINLSGATGVADLTSATAATINQIREAFQIQRLYERDARGGSRYTEIIRSHFGVISPDQRLQRPEYLGGGSQRVNINPVAQNSETDTNTPQGNLAAFGVSASSGSGFTKSFVEHCIIIGLISARADLNYQQGLHRMFSRRTRWDFYWPALAHLGEQSVLNKEIYAQGSLAATDDDVFGYQERFAEYRYKPSQITSLMRSNFPFGSLDTWHLAQDFDTLPTLSSDFIEENPPIERVIAVSNEPHFLLDAYFDYKCARPMPTYGVPGMVDHF